MLLRADPVGISLRIERAEVSYGAVTALHSLSLSVQPGEFFCLLGPSGCGKTTLLNAIAGFIPLQGGHIFLGGEDVTALAPQRRRIGFVFQNYALYPHMTVAQNVGYGLKVRKRPSAEVAERVRQMLSLVKLEHKEERYPTQLSGGEQQRVAIARALAVAPRLLLMDEPLSSLDARLRSEMRLELKRIQQATGVTTVFVTHDQEEALSMADRMAVLNEGRVEQIGSPHDVYQRPITLFVAGFVGRSNVLRGTVSSSNGESVFLMRGHPFPLRPEETHTRGPAALVLRPEEIWLDSLARGGKGSPGTVISASYGGSTITYRVATAIGEIDVCRLRNDGRELEIGSSIHWGWPVGAGHLIQGGGNA